MCFPSFRKDVRGRGHGGMKSPHGGGGRGSWWLNLVGFLNAVADKKSWWSRSDDQTPIEVEHGHVVSVKRSGCAERPFNRSGGSGMKKAAIYTDGLTIPICLFHPASETEVFKAVADK